MPLKSVTLEKLERMQKEVSTIVLLWKRLQLFLRSHFPYTLHIVVHYYAIFLQFPNQFRHKNSWNFKNQQEQIQKTLKLLNNKKKNIVQCNVSTSTSTTDAYIKI